MRPEVGVVEEEGYKRRIVPDVAVVRRPPPEAGGGAVAVLEAPRTTISKSIDITVRSEPIRHAFVEIRDPTRGHKLITLIEIVSPSNKRRGVDRQAYLQKQREVLDSDANLIEVDLLRTGERLLSNLSLQQAIAQLEPPPDYLVLVNRAWQRVGDAVGYQIFPIPLAEPLPCISVPLRQDQDEVPLDLQYVFNGAYDRGPYRRGAIDYGQPPQASLPGEAATWVEQQLRQWQAGPSHAGG
jgi:hypothetical protein